MDRLSEFIVGLQTILDSPNPPRSELVSVIQSTQRDFLASALAVSTITWPTRTHLELVKIVISLPIPEPSLDSVLADPNTSHEADPFFGADYFDKLRQQLLSMPIQSLAAGDGSWVKNIGFSIEATIMQACRRADALEKLEELSKADEAATGQDLSRIRMYCAQVLGQGTLAVAHWVAIARMVFTMFYVLPFSTQTMGVHNSQSMDPCMAQLIMHYGSWLQIVMQMIENHGPALCRRMPTVIEDPATRQFKWGIPTLHAVATTELLRNFIARRILLQQATAHVVDAGASSAQDAGATAWASDPEKIRAEEQRLEQMEQSILGQIIAKDASAVYGMMSEQHRLLQMLDRLTHDVEPSVAIPGSEECLGVSLSRACYGLAPVLGFEETALSSAMDMGKLLECLNEMKSVALHICYSPLYGCYPHGASSLPDYTELLALRMATTLFNIDQPWGDVANALAPDQIADIPPALAMRLTKALRTTAAYFDVFSLNTTEPPADTATPELYVLNTAWMRLMEHQFARSTYSECLGSVLRSDSRQEIALAGQKSSLALGLVGVCEFVKYAETFVAPDVLYSQTKVAVDTLVQFYASNGRAAKLAEILGSVQTSEWRALASARFKVSSQASDTRTATVFAILWSSAHRIASSKQQQQQQQISLDAQCWQATISLCYPESAFLAYIIVVQCLEAARALVRPGGSGGWDVVLNQQGIDSLLKLELAMSENGRKSWAAADSLLFVPAIYSDHGAGAGAAAAKYTQSQFAGALHILTTSSSFAWAQQLGLPATAPPFTEGDMRQVGSLVSYYVENAPGFFQILATLTPTAAAPTGKGMKAVSDTQRKSNPFVAPHILSKLPSSDSQSSSTHACDVQATVRQWRQNVARLSYSESRKYIQSLIAECYPSPSKHYLEQVIVSFIGEEPVVGVELVIGSIADHMWRNQVVYTRRASPFYAIRSMFSPVKRNAAGSASKGSCVDATATELAKSKSEPVFNAVVGGRVRSHSRSRDGPAKSTPAATPSNDKPLDRRTGEGASHRSTSEAENDGAVDVEGDEEAVSHPVACHRLLLLLTALRYGNSLSDTPIYSWLTDCLDHAPRSMLKVYFGSLLSSVAPTFGSELPVESDWKKKTTAFVSMWMRDSRLRSKPLTLAAGSAILCHVARSGDQWAKAWEEWSYIATDTVWELFTRKKTSPLQGDVIRTMLNVPVDSPQSSLSKGALAAMKAHPMWLLVDLLTPSTENDKLSFASSRDWFVVHALPQILELLAESQNARDVFGLVLSSTACLYQVVPWLDIATSLVQNVPLSHGCPVAMSASVAKRHFIAYLSPLARVLFAIAGYVEGEADAADDSSITDMDSSETDGEQDTAKPAAGSPVVSESASDAAGAREQEFDWQWIDQRLVLYLSSSSDDTEAVEDTVDALLDVYTYCSVHNMRQSIENVVVASCLHSPGLTRVALRRIFSKRPLDVFTLHSLRPKSLSTLPPLAPNAADSDSAFRPGAELHPITKRLLLLSLEGNANSTSAGDCAREIASLIDGCMWDIAEEPDVRRNLIALKPRLIPKEQRPAATATGVSHEAVVMTTSGALHITAEAYASSAAYALDRCVYLLGLLVTRAQEDAAASAGIRLLCLNLAHSRVFLATLLTAIGDSMRQFATLPTTRELLNALWAVADGGDAEVGGMKISQTWTGVNFLTLAQRINAQTPEEYTTWGTIQGMPAR
ncbi:hypothetical protein GQ54DRAFT_302517 [Martensiomyces pterosporus]|nr:hypothetical protein GQ54DRAFT_302517 [Martensiomyces pterosporus]